MCFLDVIICIHNLSSALFCTMGTYSIDFIFLFYRHKLILILLVFLMLLEKLILMKLYRFELLFFEGTVITRYVLRWGADKQPIYPQVSAYSALSTD